MKLSTQPYKGARDFYPVEKRLQKYIFEIWQTTAQSFGYQQYDAPIIEPIELYLSKTSDEIVNHQTYSFQDRGGRQVTLRPEMTPTVSRMVAAKRQELAMPLRLFSMPNVWRYERPQKGRLREHWQLNVDLFGVDTIEADHEIIVIASQVMHNFGAQAGDYKIRVNSRQLINHFFTTVLGLTEADTNLVIRHIDKINKMPRAVFEDQLVALPGLQSNPNAAQQILELLAVTNVSDLPNTLQSHSSLQEVNKLFNLLEASQVENAVFDITLMRGFDYYTDIVFEVFDTNPENNRSLFGGGRYDGLVGSFGVEPLPTVGFGMGDVRIGDFLKTHDLIPKLQPETDASVIIVGDSYKLALPVIKAMRSLGLNIAVDFSTKKIDKKINNAKKADLKFVIFIGQDEISKNNFKLKNIETGDEQELSVEQIAKTLSSAR